MVESVPFRCLVPAEATELFEGEDGAAVGRVAQASGADISVSDEDNTPASLTDRIVTIRGTQQAQQAASRLIIERFYEAQKVYEEDIGVFVLLVPSALATAMSADGTISKIMELSGAELSVQEAITGTEDRPVRIVGSFQKTVAAVFRLCAWVQVLTSRAEQASGGPAVPPENEEGCPAVVEDTSSALQAAPGANTSGDGQLDVEQPDAEQPATGMLDVAEPCAEQPEAEQPEEEQPEAEAEEQLEPPEPAHAEPHGESDDLPRESTLQPDSQQPEEQPDEEEPAEGEVAMATQDTQPTRELELFPSLEPRPPEEASPRHEPSGQAAEEISSPEPAVGSNFHSPSRRSSAPPCRCLAPGHACDLLIGFNGEGADEIAQKTGAQISVMDEEDIPEYLSDQIVVIEGDLKGQVMACRCVVETLFQAQGIGDKEQGLFVMLVPLSHYGAVAEKVTALSEQTGADLVLEEEEIEGLQDYPLQIVGPVMECTTAAYRILQMLQDVDGAPAPDDSPLLHEIRQWSGRGDDEGAKERPKLSASRLAAPLPMNGSKRKGRQMSLQFAVPAAVAAWIVGRKGQSINEIRSRSGASVDVSKEGARYRVIDIHGAEEALMTAIELVLEQASGLPDGWSQSTRIVLPAGTAGYIIGRGGEAIKELRRSSGAEIDLDKLSAGDEQLLVIRGAVEVIVHAAQLVAGRIAEVTGAAPKPRNDAEQLKALLAESDQSEASLTLLLPADAVNRVAQSRLQALEQQTGSQIEIHVLGGRTSGVQQMTIAGTRAGNALAILHLQEMFAEHLKPGGSAAARMVAQKRAEQAERADPKPAPKPALRPAPKPAPKPALKSAAKPKQRASSIGRAQEDRDRPRIFRSASVGRRAAGGPDAAKGKGKARASKGAFVIRRQ